MNFLTGSKPSRFTEGFSKKASGLLTSQMVKAMKLTFVLLTATFLQMAARGLSQNVTLTLKDAPVERVFKEIERQTGLGFLYTKKMLQNAPRVSISVSNAPVADVLLQCFKGQQLDYSIQSNTIVISRKTVIAPVVDELLLLNISGRVVNEKGQPVEGATVTVKGTKIATATDINGFFELKGVDENATLVITGVNVETFEIKINGRTNLEAISVKTRIIENAAISVNTGYQTISKERSTAAHDRVTDEILSKRPTANLATALVGQIAGLVADPQTGFTIRGRSSLSSASDRTPLLVVDGFPVEGGFATINPNDVKSIDVLKDAAASSIYGARAANGVIVVVTKGFGAKGKMNVSYNSFVSVGSKIDLDYYMNMADAPTQIAFEERLYNTFKTTTTLYTDPYTLTGGSFRGIRSPYASLLIELEKGNITQEYFDKKKQEMLNTDYKDDYNKYLLRNPFSHQQNLVISGSGEKNSYKFSALYDNDRTAFQYNNNDKVLLGFTNIFNINNNIKYTFNTNITTYNNRNNGISLAHAKTVTSPWTKLVDEDGNYTRLNYENYEPRVKAFESRLPYQYRYNLLEEASLRNNNYRGQDLRIQNEFEFKITGGLRFRPMFQYELFTYEDFSIYDEKTYAVRNYSNWISTLDAVTGNYITQIPRGGIYRKNGEARRQSVKMRAQVDYNKNFGGKHEIIALAGGEVISTKNEVASKNIIFGYNTLGLNYPLFDLSASRLNMFGGNVLENTESYEGNLIYDFKAQNFRQDYRYNERYIAGYFNGAYTYDRKYTASISARTDASNYVSKTVREKFSPFYSAGLRWNIAEENFMKKTKFIDRLALRTTYGVTGNAAGKTQALSISVFSSIAATTETGNLNQGTISGRDNDFLTWEKTYSTNIGTDFSLFKGKLSGSIDVYRRHSKDLLSAVQTSQVVQSTTSLNLNLAEVLNKGVEVSLGTKLNIGKDFSWNGTVNFDYNYNEVLAYKYTWPSLFYYLGSNTQGFITGLPTDRLMMVHLAGTTKDGFFIQQRKNGELIAGTSNANLFSDLSSFGMGRPPAQGTLVKDDDRMYYQGRTTPPATLGFTNTFYYKGFSFFSVITGRFGYKFIANDEVLAYNLISNSYSATGLASLQSPSLVATTATGNLNPALINASMINSSTSLRNFYSDQVVHDASHIRLNEIYMGYDISERTLGKLKNFFKSVTIYSQARNLGLLWKANDIDVDPEFKIGTVKPVKTFTFGVRLGM